MSEKTYNGWTNYQTWRVNLEWFDGMDCSDWGNDLYEVSKALKEHVVDSIMSQYDMVSDSRVVDYALAFVQDVNWREIADHMIDTYSCRHDWERASATDET